MEEPASGAKRMVRSERVGMEWDKSSDRVSSAALHVKKADKY